MSGPNDHLERGGGHVWSNGPGVLYEWHSHPYDKVLVCVEGSIIFHTREADHPLEPGRQLHLAAGTDHAATVGPLGVTCREFHSS
jgi:quercetin dioxygenase-like cupin family protein